MRARGKQLTRDLMVKLLNLAVDWLHRLLPHILSKASREKYMGCTGVAWADEDPLHRLSAK
eukprot:7330092-Pyramimonas_sp.AAC.1